MNSSFKSLTAALLITGLASSCVSTTIITSEPSGAKVYIDGSHMGVTPYTYSDTKIVGATTQVTLKKEGCKDSNYMLNRSEKFEVGPCIGGVLVLVPFLWIMGYNPTHGYELDCSKKTSDEFMPADDKSLFSREPSSPVKAVAWQCPAAQ